MSIDHDLSGTTYSIPERKQRGWGSTVTALLGALTDTLDGLSFTGTAGNPLLVVGVVAAADYAAGATLTPTKPVHLVGGDGAARTLNATTAIADGEIDGQLLILLGTSSTNTLTVPAAANTLLNGPCTLTAFGSLLLMWDDTNSVWREVARNI